MRSEVEVTLAIEKYADLVKRLCMVNLKNYADTEDIFQTVFLKYALCSTAFESVEHEKAWMIRVTVNACKKWHRSPWRKRVSYEEYIAAQPDTTAESREILRAVMELPRKYRMPIYLYYFEGYSGRCEKQSTQIRNPAVR